MEWRVDFGKRYIIQFNDSNRLTHSSCSLCSGEFTKDEYDSHITTCVREREMRLSPFGALFSGGHLPQPMVHPFYFSYISNTLRTGTNYKLYCRHELSRNVLQSTTEIYNKFSTTTSISYASTTSTKYFS
jgi:hypothetical protein